MRYWWLFAAAGLAMGCKDSDADGTRDKRDCAPVDSMVNPDAQEVCDGIDNDCDGQVDEDVSITAFWDRDRDGYGDPEFARRVCTLPDDGATSAGDCDDFDPKVHPDAAELCDGADNDCDTEVDEDAHLTFYKDADLDGHGVLGDTTTACFAPPGYTGASDDCDDTEPLAWTDAPEACDGIDNDCDGGIDEDLEPVRQWSDLDGDGYGDADSPVLACGPGLAVADNALDCDDADPARGPHAIEVRGNAFDEDCDGYVDEFGVGPGNEFATVDDALGTAIDGSVVQLDDGFHIATVDLGNRDVILAGEGCDRTELYGGAQGTTLTARAGSIRGMTISGGSGSPVLAPDDLLAYGGGLLIDGDVTVSSVCVVNNAAVHGAGVAVLGGHAVFTDVLVAENTSSGRGGGIYGRYPATIDIHASRVIDNSSAERGAGIGVDGVDGLVVTNTVIAANRCAGKGCGATSEVLQELPENGDPAILHTSHVTYDFVTFHANESEIAATTASGEALNANSGTLILTNSLFTGHPVPRVVIETGESFDLVPTITKEYLGFRGNAGPDEDYDFYRLDRIAGDPEYVLDDPTLRPVEWDLRLRQTSGFLDRGDPDPLLADPDGSVADLGAYGGPSAPPGWDFGLAVDGDLDGLIDGWEVNRGTNRWIDDAADDDDGDGLLHSEEHTIDSDPLAPDTDEDGVLDGVEIGLGADPNAPRDQAPVVAVAADRMALVGEPAPLDASGSFDPNGDTLTYTWTVTEAPATSIAVVASPANPVTTFIPDVDGTYTLTVTVDDGATVRSGVTTLRAFGGVIVPDDYASVQAAIDAGNAAIGVRPGTWLGAIDTNGGSRTIVGLGSAEAVVLDGGGDGSTIRSVGGNLTVGHVSVIGGFATEGGGIHAEAAALVELVDVTVTQNYAVDGGGMWVSVPDGSLELRDCRFVDNTAGANGGGLWLTGESYRQTLLLERGTFAGNEAVEGGALWLDGGFIENGLDSDFTVNATLFLDNEATVGAAWRHTGVGSDLNARNITLVGNRGTSLGWSDLGRVIVMSDALADNEVTTLWDGTTGVDWGHFDGVWDEEPGTLWYTDAGLVATLPTWVHADPRIGVFTNDGDASDDRVGLRLGSPAIDAGFLDHVDPDRSRADIGACGGPYADPSCMQFLHDVDGDELSDGWELALGLDPTVADAADDPDGDGLDNLQEHTLGTRPDRADSDSDGVDDDVEIGGAGDPLDDRDHRPLAVAGGPFRVEVGQIATADASASFDPDGQAVTFQWRVLGGPAASAVTTASLEGENTAVVSFVPDASGAFRLGLTVSAGGVPSRELTVWIQVPRELLIPAEYADLDEAFDNANAGDILVLGAGEFPTTFDPGDVPITIAGAGIGSTVLVPSGSDPMLTVLGGGFLTVRDLTLRGGVGDSGGALYCNNGSVSLERVHGEQNTANKGGVLYLFECVTTLTDVSFVGNYAADGGAVNADLGSLDWTGGEAALNEAALTGGALRANSVVTTLRNVIFRRNWARYDGSAVFTEFRNNTTEGSLDVEHVTFSGNRGGDSFIGALHRRDQVPITVTHSLFVDNDPYAVLDESDGTLLTFDYNGWSQNQANTDVPGLSTHVNDVNEGPKFVSFDALGLGIAEDLHLRDESPMRDAGADNNDPDGSRSDFGAYGGPFAPPDWDVWFRDTDGDGMADGWEEEFGLDPAANDAGLDPDGDGLTNLVEFGVKSEPFEVDTDFDGVDDPVEVGGGTDPGDPADFAPSAAAGIDRTVLAPGTAAVFTGIGIDPQGDGVGFQWSLIGWPGRSNLTDADLVGANTPTVTLTPDIPGEYVLQLVTTDGAGFSEPDTAVLHVGGNLRVPDDYPTVDGAVAAAEPGATITIEAGTFPTRAVLEGKDLTFVGAGRDLTVLDGEGRHGVLVAIENEIVSLEGLTIRGGLAGRGGGIWVDGGELTLDDVAIAENTAGDGGGLFVEQAPVVVVGSAFLDNRAGAYGGGVSAATFDAVIDLSQVLVAGNSARNDGGGIRLSAASLVATNVVFADNEAGSGGALFATSATGGATFEHVTAVGNDASDQGGFVYMTGGTPVTLRDTIVFGSGGSEAIFQSDEASSLVQTYSLFAANTKNYTLHASETEPADGVDGNDLTGDPALLGVLDDGDWTNDDWSLGAGSAAIDAADPSGSDDVDGSAPDMGAFGGADGGWTP